jgi:peroxiredoxin
VILGISLDTDGVPFILNSFVKRMKIPYPILIGTGEVAEDYQVFGIPTTFLIDKEGKIVKRFEGVVSPIHFENALKNILETKS